MRIHLPFLLLTSFGLSAAVLNAQNVVANRDGENRFTTVSGATPIRAAEASSATLQKYGELPLSFERHGESEFVARGKGYAMDIRGARATIALPFSGSSGAMDMEFVDGQAVAAIPERELPGKVNYILGNDPRRWRLGLSTYERVTYRNLYPGVNVVYYGNQNQLEFDLELKAGADVKSVRMRFSGLGKPRTDASGSLILGNLRLKAPAVLQEKKTVSARYRTLANGDVGFELGAYDRRKPLIIDPTLVYSTQMGGGDQFNRGNAIALDASGNAYIAGLTYADDFPALNPAFAGYDANGDGFISKINPTGTALIYSTYIGGSNYDYLQGIAVDSTGAAWVVGYTYSNDFPLLSAYQNTYAGGPDAIVVKLSPSGGLAYSTFLGGPSYAFGYSVAVDPFGNAYVTGETGAGFPTTAGVYQPVIQGGTAAFVTKFSAGASLTWSTFAGGTSFDYATGIAVDEFGNTYITGVSYSSTFPGAPPGGAQPVNKGNGDAFVAKLNFTGSGLLYFTFLGGSGYDLANAIAVDPVSGIAVVAGLTKSADLSTSAGAVQSTNAGGQNGFVAKLNAEGSAFLYTTYLGGNRNDLIQGLAIDSAGDAYVAGTTDSNTFPVNSAIQNSMQGNSTSLFHSTNTGSTWAPFDANIPGAVNDISPDPVVAGTIVVSSEDGIYRTTNGGATWTQQSTLSDLTLSRSPANPAVIYGINCNIYQSTDNGVTWSYTGTTSPNCASRIVADPLNASTAYAYGASNVQVQKTVNNGASWSPAVTGLPANQNVGKMVAASDGSLYVALRNAISGQNALGVYESSDQAGSWVSANTGLYSNFPWGDLAVGPSNSVYISDFFNLYETTNDGASWSLNGSLPTAFVGCIANTLGASAVSPSVVYWGPCYFGWAVAPLAASTNAGATWNPASGLGPTTISRVVGDPINAARAYALSPVNTAPFVAKIDPAGKNLLYSTYLGDTGSGYAIATNGTGDVFVTGNTSSKAFPITPLALQGDSPNPPPTEVFVTQISDETASCSFSVSPQPYLLGPYESTLQYSVVAPSGCPWSASSNQGWATVLTGAAGTGTGVIYVLLNENTTGATRAATLTIAGQAVTLSQLSPNCSPSFSIGSSTVPASGGTLQLNVVAAVGCGWNLLNNDPNAVTVVSGASGTGNGPVTLSVTPNLGPNTRTFNFLIRQGGSETISQAGTTAPAVVSTITSSPTGASITVTGTGCIPGTYTTPASLTWNANTNCTINFATPQTIGGLPYTFNSASVNGGPSTATNPLTVNSGASPPTINATFLAPCTYSLTPSTQSFSASGGLGSFTVNTASTCTWSPVPSANWITILPSGSKGTAKVNYAVASTAGAARAGTILAGGQAFSVSQSEFICSYAINPASASVSDPGGTVQTTVNAGAGCPWTATSNVSWITVTSGASASGTGAVIMHVASNTGGQRSGTATIAGQTYTVTQGAGACGSVDVSTEAHVSLGEFVLFAVVGGPLFTQTVSVTNASSSVIQGPVYLVTVGMPTHQFPTDPFFQNSGLAVAPPGTTITTCFTTAGDYLIPLSAGNLAAGQTANLGTLTWIQGTPGLGYSTRVLSGTPAQ